MLLVAAALLPPLSCCCLVTALRRHNLLAAALLPSLAQSLPVRGHYSVITALLPSIDHRCSNATAQSPRLGRCSSVAIARLQLCRERAVCSKLFGEALQGQVLQRPRQQMVAGVVGVPHLEDGAMELGVNVEFVPNRRPPQICGVSPFTAAVPSC